MHIRLASNALLSNTATNFATFTMYIPVLSKISPMAIYMIIHLSNFNKKYNFGTKMDSIVKEKSHTGSFVKQNEQFVFVVFGITALYFSILSYTAVRKLTKE